MSIQFKRGTKAKVTASTDKLLSGQPLFATDTKQLYIGDGEAINTQKPVTANLQAGSANVSTQQLQDGTTGTFSFTNKNPNATTLDSTLTGEITYGGVGEFSTAFGGKSSAQGKRSFAAGSTTIAKGNYSHVEGDNAVTLGADSHAEGYQTVTGPSAQASHAEGITTQALGLASHSEGAQSKSIANYSHAEGVGAQALNEAPSSGGGSSGSGGTGTPGGSDWDPDTKIGQGAHAEGSYTKTVGYASHAEGLRTQALGHYSHSEGSWTYAKGKASHSEGEDTTATGDYCHAEGLKTESSNSASHAEGYQTHAIGNTSHAEGSNTWAIGQCSHAGGMYSSASGKNSFAHGENVKASRDGQAVFGQYNLEDSNSLFIVGNGTSDYVGNRKNAFQVLTDGRAKVQSAPTEDGDVLRWQDLTVKQVSNLNSDIASSTGTYITGIKFAGNTLKFTKGTTIVSVLDNQTGSIVTDVSGNNSHTITLSRGSLSGGKEASSGYYISQVYPNGLDLQVKQEKLPTLSVTSGTSGSFVTGISVNDNTITVNKENLPSKGNSYNPIFINSSGYAQICNFSIYVYQSSGSLSSSLDSICMYL